MVGLALIFFVVSIGLIGWITHFLFFHDSSTKESTLLERIMVRFLSGFGSVSVILLAAALTGLFFRNALLCSLAVLSLLFLLKKRQQRPSNSTLSFIYYFIFCLALGCASLALAKLTGPYESVINGSDASSYIASASQLVNSGSLTYADPLILEMTPQEHELFYSQREQAYGRFRAGVLIVRADLGIVSFGYLPLLPAWLGAGNFVLGSQNFLYVLSFFTALGILVLFLLGRKVSGLLVGFSLPLILFFFILNSIFPGCLFPKASRRLYFVAAC